MLASGFGRMVFLCVLVVPAGCGEDVVPPEEAPRAGVQVQFATFGPAELTIARGTVVRWTNASSRFHTITPDDEMQPGTWVGAPVSSPGQTFEHRFDRPGRYPYHCEPHFGEGMVGVIVVE